MAGVSYDNQFLWRWGLNVGLTDAREGLHEQILQLSAVLISPTDGLFIVPEPHPHSSSPLLAQEALCFLFHCCDSCLFSLGDLASGPLVSPGPTESATSISLT